jgi:hypothetical protein
LVLSLSLSLLDTFGIPMQFRKLLNKEWKGIEDRFKNKLGCWIGKLMSYEARLTLTNGVLTRLPMFMLSIFEIPKGVRKILDCYRFRFFWLSDEHKHKYSLMQWDVICLPKDQ